MTMGGCICQMLFVCCGRVAVALAARGARGRPRIVHCGGPTDAPGPSAAVADDESTVGVVVRELSDPPVDDATSE